MAQPTRDRKRSLSVVELLNAPSRLAQLELSLQSMGDSQGHLLKVEKRRGRHDAESEAADLSLMELANARAPAPAKVSTFSKRQRTHGWWSFSFSLSQ